MRQLTPLTNLVLACLSAVGLLLSLELPWYARPGGSLAPDSNDGPIEALAARIGRTVTSTGASTGNEVLTGRATLLLVVAAAVVVLSLAMLVPGLRGALRDILRGISLVSPVAVLLLAVRAPAAQGLEFRWGLVATVAIAVFMASCAWHGSSARSPRAVAAPRARPVA